MFNAAPQPKHVDFRRGLGPQAQQMFETTGFQAHRLGDLHWLLSLPRESLCRVGSGRSELSGCLRSPVQTGGGECPFRLWLEQERNFAGQLARSLGKTAGTAGGLREALQPSGGDSAADPPPPSAHPGSSAEDDGGREQMGPARTRAPAPRHSLGFESLALFCLGSGVRGAGPLAPARQRERVEGPLRYRSHRRRAHRGDPCPAPRPRPRRRCRSRWRHPRPGWAC